MWTGLAPVYMLACCKAILGGPNRKPIYKVTRKTHEFAWYWRETLPSAILATLVPVALLVGVIDNRLPHPALLIAAGYWGFMASATLGGFVTRGWFGKQPLRLPGLWDRRRQTTERVVPRAAAGGHPDSALLATRVAAGADPPTGSGS
jgi:cellulose synthase (UDP-forming)